MNFLRVRKALRDCKVLDPVYLQYGTSHDSLFCMIDELDHFNFEEFDDGVHPKMSSTIPFSGMYRK